MTGWIDRIGTVLLDASLATTAITGLVVLAILQCRQPVRRRGWARMGLVSTLAVLPLAALNPFPRFDIHGPLHFLFRDSSTISSCSTDRGADSPSRAEWCDRTDDRKIGFERPPPILQKVGRVFVVGYLLGFSIGLGWIGLGLWGASRRARRGYRPSLASIRLYDSLITGSRGIRPRLLVSQETSRPILVGSLSPVILIPPGLDEEDSSERLRLSLLHELAHVENHDHYFMPLAYLAEAAWFFLPTFWWIRDQLKLDQEFLADRRAVSRFGSTGEYASSLLEIASDPSRRVESCSELRMVPPPLPMPTVASALFQRVQMLLKCPFPIEGSTPLWWRWSSTLTLSLATLAASCLTIRSLGSWEVSAELTLEKESNPFRLAQLVISQRPDLETFELRYQLPPQFVLSLEVMSGPGEPTLMEVLGHRIGPLESSPDEAINGGRWHRIRIRRLQGFDLVEIDGSPSRTESISIRSASWLTIRPLNTQPTHIRNLSVD